MKIQKNSLSPLFFGKKIWTIGFIILIQVAFAQQDQGGILVPSDSLKSLLQTEKNIYLPRQGFIVYDSPKGEYAGKFIGGPPSNPPGGIGYMNPSDSLLFASFAPRNSRPVLISLDYFFHSSDNCYHLSFYNMQDGFVQIGEKQWISVSDITSAGYQLLTWTSFYTEINKIIQPPPDEKTAVRLSPYVDAVTIVLVDDADFIIQVTGETEGYFAPVKVTHYKTHPCFNGDHSEQNIIKIYEGWIQIIDENGKPLVSHNPGGC